MSFLLAALLATELLQHSLAQEKGAPKPAAPPTKTKAVMLPASALVPSREQAIVDEINLARTNPAAYVKFLEALRQHYKGNKIHFPYFHILVTNEGVKALDEAIRFVNPNSLVQLLKFAKASCQLQRFMRTIWMQPVGVVTRVQMEANLRIVLVDSGHGLISADENVVYDSRNARDDVIGIIIDDGVANRGHLRTFSNRLSK